MGMEKINFFWYLRTISRLALPGYFSDAIFYILHDLILHQTALNYLDLLPGVRRQPFSPEYAKKEFINGSFQVRE